MDDRSAQNLMKSVMEMWIEPEVLRRQANGAPRPFAVRAAQIILHPDGQPTVLLNEEVIVVATVRLKPGHGPLSKGQVAFEHEMDGIERIEPPAAYPNCGHITIVQTRANWHIAFDSRLNMARAPAYLASAKEFLNAAKYAEGNGHWRAAVENLFNAAELAAKGWVVTLGANPDAGKHSHIHSYFNRFGALNIEPEQLKTFNQLVNIRHAARYDDATFVPAEGQVAKWTANVGELLATVERRISRIHIDDG